MKLSSLKLKPLYICALLLATAFKSQAQEVISLQRAVDLALERNLTVKQAQFNEALTEQDIKQSRYNQLPNVSTAPQAYFNFGRNLDPSTNQFINQRIFAVAGNIQSSVVLFQGGQLRNLILQNKIALDADKSNTAKVKNDLILNVITTYLQILTNQDLVAAAQQQVDIAKLSLDRTQKSFNVGNQTAADLSQAKAQQATNELDLTNAQNQLAVSILTLKQYMEMNPATDIVIEKPDISRIQNVQTAFDPQSVLSEALKVNPDVLLAETRAKVFQQAVKVAKGGFYPSLILFGSLGSNYSNAFFLRPGEPYPIFNQLSDNFNQSIGVTLQIPIFNRYNAHTNVNKARINLMNAQVGAQLARTNLSKTIFQAVLDVQAASKKYQSATQTYQANKDAFNVVQQRYNVGLVNSLDYNTSLTNLNRSQFDMIQARYEMIFRSKIIDYYLGNQITLQ